MSHTGSICGADPSIADSICGATTDVPIEQGDSLTTSYFTANSKSNFSNSKSLSSRSRLCCICISNFLNAS